MASIKYWLSIFIVGSKLSSKINVRRLGINWRENNGEKQYENQMHSKIVENGVSAKWRGVNGRIMALRRRRWRLAYRRGWLASMAAAKALSWRCGQLESRTAAWLKQSAWRYRNRLSCWRIGILSRLASGSVIMAATWRKQKAAKKGKKRRSAGGGEASGSAGV